MKKILAYSAIKIKANPTERKFWPKLEILNFGRNKTLMSRANSSAIKYYRAAICLPRLLSSYFFYGLNSSEIQKLASGFGESPPDTQTRHIRVYTQVYCSTVYTYVASHNHASRADMYNLGLSRIFQQQKIRRTSKRDGKWAN